MFKKAEAWVKAEITKLEDVFKLNFFKLRDDVKALETRIEALEKTLVSDASKAEHSIVEKLEDL